MYISTWLANSGICSSCIVISPHCTSCTNGVSCAVCAIGYTGSTCSSCDIGYQGASCNACIVGYFPSAGRCLPCTNVSPLCTECSVSTSCSLCAVGWTGTLCTMCAQGYITSTCSVCDAGYYMSTGVCSNCNVISVHCSLCSNSITC